MVCRCKNGRTADFTFDLKVDVKILKFLKYVCMVYNAYMLVDVGGSYLGH